MHKYDDKLIDDYINGNDIENYQIEELENDVEFMKKVISKTNDKHMYNLCSNEVKKDYQFVKYLIMKFENDINFIAEIADFYLAHNKENDVYKLELSILMCKYIKKENSMEYDRYKTYREIFYTTTMIKIEELKQAFNSDEYTKNEFGEGFFYIHDYYEHSKITLRYFAKRFIINILNENNIDLETIVHNNFNTFKELENYGIKKYLVNLISQYDYHLASYVIVHPTVLSPFMIEIKKTKKNWDNYIITKEKEKYEIMINKVEEYEKENCFSSIISDGTSFYILGKILGIEEKIKKYYCLSEEDYDELAYMSDIIIRNSSYGFEDIRHLINIKKIMIETLNIKVNKEEIQEQNNKILKLQIK